MDEETIAQFQGITSADTRRATQYLTITEGNLEQAIQLYFESDGADLGGTVGGAGESTIPSQPANPTEREVISIDSDEENAGTGGAPVSVEDDEAMARRLQNEMYSATRHAQSPDVEGVRAPMARTTQTLVGDDGDWRDDPQSMNSAVFQQMLNRETRRGKVARTHEELYPANIIAPAVGGQAGIFNQRAPEPSIWAGEDDPEAHRENLARATGGASEKSSKSNMLAEMFRPPFELMSNLKTWDGMRAEGKELEKWILINIQDPNIFDCQVLNRDIWKDKQIQDTVREHFIFKQFTKTDPQAHDYVRFYFQAVDSQDAYPHIAIVDPRTGEQVKCWSGTPAPKPGEFLEQLHEFLDRYSLKANKRNPVANRKPERKKSKDVGQMTEEEMLEMALQNSLEPSSGPKEDDPDSLTRVDGKGKAKEGQDLATEPDDVAMSNGGEVVATSPFAQISASSPHEEPAADVPNTTRIQFRHPGGRVIRRFSLEDRVLRIYEWLKSSPLEGHEGQEFELFYMNKNLLDVVDQTIEAAGLKNGSIMIEFESGS